MKNFNFLRNLFSPAAGMQSSDVSIDCRLTVGSPSGFDAKWMLKLVSVLVLILTVGVGNVWGATFTKITSLSDLTTGDYVIVGRQGSSSWGKLVYGSLSSGKLTYSTDYSSLPSSITTTTANEIWHLTVSGTGTTRTVTIYNAGQKKYLKGNGSLSFQDDAANWTAAYSSGFRLLGTKASNYLGVNKDYNYWRDYASSTLYNSTTYCLTLYKAPSGFALTFKETGGSSNGSGLAAANATSMTISTAPTPATGKMVEGYYAENTLTTKVANADGSWAANNITGWVTSGKFTKGTAADLYIKWTDLVTTVTLDKGTDGTEDGTATITYNATSFTSITDATKTGYHLNGYYTTASGGSKVINANGSLVSSLSGWTSSSKWVKNATTATLYAQWTIDTYTIHWKVNGNDWEGSTHGSPSTSANYNTKPSTIPTAPASSDCDNSKVFVGWTATPIAGTTNTFPSDLFYTKEAAPNITGNTTFYAVFATGGVATFNSSTLSGLTEDDTYWSWTHDASGTVFDLYGDYSSRNNNIWVIGYGSSGTYGEITAPASSYLANVAITLSAASNKVVSVTQGTLTTNSTAQNVVFRSAQSSTQLKPATSSTQTKITNMIITYVSSTPAFATSCCTALGPINGSVSWSGGNTATVSWANNSNVNSYSVTCKAGGVSAGTVGSISGTTTKTCSITGLTAGTAYTITINATGKSDYCDASQEITSTAPQITASGTLTGSDYAEGSGPGTVKNFSVSGVGLTGNLTVTAPTNFEVSLDNSNWGSSKEITASGTLSSTTVYVRLAAGNSAGTYGPGAITISGGGAANNTSVTIAGTVSSACSVPSIGVPTLTSIASGSITVSCPTISGGTNCDVDDYGFVWKKGSEPTISDNKTQKGTNNQSSAYSDALTIDVDNNTGSTYYFKAYAHNTAGNNVSASSLVVTPQKVTFNSNGGSSVATVYLNNGGTVSKPSDPSKDHYEFGGWYTDNGTWASEVNFSSTINEDKTYYAKWNPVSYSITATLTNVSNSSLPSSFTYTGATTTALNSTFTVDATNFFLPSSITVTMGGSPLTKDTHYTYNNTTGAFTFTAVINGDIVITATATAKLKSIAITTQPTTRKYLVGETFSSSGAAVTATMGDGTTPTVSATWIPSGALSAGTGQTATASYTENGITKTATTTIDVYSVTVQKVNEDGDAIDAAGVSASITTRALSASATSGSKYVFKNWEFSGSNNGLAIASTTSASTSVTGTPTGNVTIKAVFYKPVVITWLKGGVAYETGSPTTTIARGSQWKDLTLPTAPADNSLGACADKFMGWSNTMAVEWVKEDTHTAPATLFTSVSGNTTVINAPITFRAVFATAGGDGDYEQVTSLAGIKEGSAYFAYYGSYSGSRWYGVNAINTVIAPVDVSAGVLTTSKTGDGAYSLQEFTLVAVDASNYEYYIKIGDKYVTGSTTNGTDLSLGNDAYLWKFNDINSTTYNLEILHDAATDCWIKVGVGSATGGKFRSYTSTGQQVSLFQSSSTYSDYVTVCCTQYDISLASSGSVTGGTFTASPTSACEDAEVTLSATPADGYSFAGWTVTKTASPYTDITSTNVDGNTLTMPGYGVTVNATFATLTGITVKTAPTKTTYCEGDNFDPTGLVITASFSNSTTLDIPYSGNEAKFTFSPTTAASLTTGNTSVTITYSGQSTSQAITVNSKLAVTKTGSGTVTGGTFTVDNATACAGTTINIEAEAASHYTFGSWTITKTSDGTDVTASVSIGSATSATTSFTMPAYAVTVTATFNENAYHTATFKNNGMAVSGYDAVKTYDGTKPSAPTLTDITDACDKTDCNKFYGWIAEDGIWNKTIDNVAGKTIYRRASDIPNVSGADVVYHAVWAKGEAGPELSAPTPIIYWARQSIAASTNISATSGTGTLNSNVAFTDATYEKVYNSGSLSSYPTITLSSLNMSSATGSTVNISFFTRGTNASAGTLTVKYTDSGNEYTAGTVTVVSKQVCYHEVSGIPKTATQIKLEHGANGGNLAIGTIKIFEPLTTSYTFTELTSENTSGWANADWDGYYLITNGQVSLQALDGNGIGEKNITSVTASDGVISTTNAGAAFKVTWVSGSGYKMQGVGSGDYLNTASNSVAPSASVVYMSEIGYNSITDGSSNKLYWNSSKFGFYSSTQTSPVLYKIMESFTEFRITCCDKTVTIGTPTKTGSGTVTFASGGDAYAAGDEVETCYGATTITATVTPSNGYQCTVLSFTRSDSEDLTPDPAISVPFTGAQNYDLTFEQNADGVTLNTTVTFVALIDHYIDNMHYNTTINKSGGYGDGKAPTLSDETKGEQCTGLHYRFIGWIPEIDMNMETGVPTTTANMVAGGQTGMYATGTNYYAIWAEEE